MIIDSTERLLVVAAHPDDEILGCGGTLARAIGNDAAVRVVFLGEGISARFDQKDFHGDDYKAAENVRNDGAKKALKLIGVESFSFGQNYCCRFDTVPILDIVKLIESEIRAFEPTSILTHNPAEVNIDHRVTYRAVETATRPFLNSRLKSVVGFEIPCSGNWAFDDVLVPNLYVDVSENWEAKLAAWHCYVGEDRPFPFPRSDAGLLAMAQYRGMQSGLKLAEAFKIFRHVQ